MRTILSVLTLYTLFSWSSAQAQQPLSGSATVQQYIYVMRPIPRLHSAQGWTAAEGQVAARHLAHLKQLTDAGTAIIVGRTPTVDSTTFGMVIIEAGSIEQARQIMQSDPIVQEGLFTAELFPFRVFFQRQEPPR
jgi:uncharacterized protein YciI